MRERLETVMSGIVEDERGMEIELFGCSAGEPRTPRLPNLDGAPNTL